MATYRTQVPTSWSAERAFGYMADFANAATWDPGVSSAAKLTEGPVRRGTVFRLVVPVAGRGVRFDYRVVHFDPPRSVTFVAETPLLRSNDSVVVTPEGAGSVVRYDAVLEGRGPLRLAEPLLARAFARIGDRAAKGLRETLPDSIGGG